tara:strand:- start:1007 stop:2515 length:1509 start_codon:yes stop_codon:yes gene_type:complete
MSQDEKDSTWLPPHLRELLGDVGSEKSRHVIKETLESTGKKIKTGRMGRAFGLSKVALRGGSRWLVDKARDSFSNEEEKQARSEQRGVEIATQMLKTFSEMRGAAMKIGQMLSYLDDMLPPEGQKILALLQRDAAPMPYEKVTAQFQRDFGKPPEDLYQHFEPTPIAAASIGQVHKAILHDGTPVAVKVQYPGIKEAMEADLKNAKFLGLFQQVMFFRTDTKAIMNEIQERLIDECNYLKEAEYQQIFYDRFQEHPSIVVPQVHHDLCGEHILTTTFHDGLGFYEWLATDPSQDARERVTKSFYRFYLGSFYLDGLFHCDPHPGNYTFLEDGRIVFFDYGCTRHFEESRRQLWIELCKAAMRDDRETFHKLAVPIGFFQEGQSYDREAFEGLIQYLYKPYLKDEPFDFRAHPPRDTFREMFVENANLFKLNMPADAVFLNRIGFGLVSLLSEIGSPLHCTHYASSYFEGFDPDWPDDPHCVNANVKEIDKKMTTSSPSTKSS